MNSLHFLLLLPNPLPLLLLLLPSDPVPSPSTAINSLNPGTSRGWVRRHVRHSFILDIFWTITDTFSAVDDWRWESESWSESSSSSSAVSDGDGDGDGGGGSAGRMDSKAATMEFNTDGVVHCNKNVASHS
ncbi:hypothetical protein HKX48_002631, partial [Thoreauomyces humboldtii]